MYQPSDERVDLLVAQLLRRDLQLGPDRLAELNLQLSPI